MAELIKADNTTAEANSPKMMLTSDEVCAYLGISKPYLYKLTCKKQIPHYKPMGKLCFFNRAELEEWLQRNRVATKAEAESAAVAYVVRKDYLRKGGRK